MLVSADCARCRKLAAQAAYILVPASRMSTGCGILPTAAIAIWVYAGVIFSRPWPVLQLIRKHKLMWGNRLQVVEKLKALSPVLKKSGMCGDFIVFEPEDIAGGTDLQLNVGHYNWTTDWNEQKQEKSKASPVLEAFDPCTGEYSNEYFGKRARELITKLVDELVGDRPLQTQSPEAGYRDWLGYEAGGSSSRPPAGVAVQAKVSHGHVRSLLQRRAPGSLKLQKQLDAILARDNLPVWTRNLQPAPDGERNSMLKAALGRLHKRGHCPEVLHVSELKKRSASEVQLTWSLHEEGLSDSDLVFDRLPSQGMLDALGDWWTGYFEAEISCKLQVELKSFRHNKRSGAEGYPWAQFERERSCKGVALLSRSEKLEKARARALYGADATHYDLLTYITGGKSNLEARLADRLDCEKGKAPDAVLEHHAKRVLSLVEGWYSADLDSKEFDKHHASSLLEFAYLEIGRINSCKINTAWLAW